MELNFRSFRAQDLMVQGLGLSGFKGSGLGDLLGVIRLRA